MSTKVWYQLSARPEISAEIKVAPYLKLVHYRGFEFPGQHVLRELTRRRITKGHSL